MEKVPTFVERLGGVLVLVGVILIMDKGRGVGINGGDYLFTPPRPMHILVLANISSNKLYFIFYLDNPINMFLSV